MPEEPVEAPVTKTLASVGVAVVEVLHAAGNDDRSAAFDTAELQPPARRRRCRAERQ